MRIFVINLARAADRRRKMEAQFAALGVPYEILEAVDGRSLTGRERARVDNNRRRWITYYPLSDNEIGCCLSHCRAMERIAAGTDLMGAIIEDDAELSPDFPRVLEAIETRAGPFDMIDLHRTFKRGEVFVPCRPLLPGFALGRIGYAHINATGYVISREGARKFLARAEPFVHAVDKALHRYWANGLDIYGLERPIVFHADGGRSYIEETREQENPAARQRYAGAGAIHWRLARMFVRSVDSAHKRLAFPAYVRKGKRAR